MNQAVKWKLVGGLEHFLFFHILEIIITIDFHVFQRGSYTSNQEENRPLNSALIPVKAQGLFGGSHPGEHPAHVTRRPKSGIEALHAPQCAGCGKYTNY